MIILDTSVLSELVRPEPSEAVLRWIAAQHTPSLFTTAISQAEMLSGGVLTSAGKRRTQLKKAIDEVFLEDFAGRILPFNEEVAPVYARDRIDRNGPGGPISQVDAMIAAIAQPAWQPSRREMGPIFRAAALKSLIPGLEGQLCAAEYILFHRGFSVKTLTGSSGFIRDRVVDRDGRGIYRLRFGYQVRRHQRPKRAPRRNAEARRF